MACMTDFVARLFSRISGKEPKDEVEAVTAMTELEDKLSKVDAFEAKLEAQTKAIIKLTTERDEAVAELVEIEGKSVKTAAELIVAEALKEGQITPAQEEWAKHQAENHAGTFATYLSTVGEGQFTPAGENVSAAARAAAGGTEDNLNAEIMAYAKTNDVPYHTAALAVKKQRAETGKEV